MFLTSLFEQRATLENPKWSLSDPDAWRNHFEDGRIAETDLAVNTDKALTLSPVWQAVKMISGDCSKLPLKVYRYRADGEGKDVDRGHQVWPHINRDGRANAEVSCLQLWRRFYAGALLYENGYLWIDRDNLGRIRGLYNLLPDRTSPVRGRNGTLWYVSEIGGKLVPLPADDVLHLTGLCWAGDKAPCLVEQARHDFGLALAARKFTSKFFANGAQHGGVLQIPPGATKEARDKIEAAVEEKRRNLDKAFRTMVLRDGYKWFSTTVDPAKAQLIELNEALVRDVARWFLLSPSRLGVKDSTSYNSEEAAKQDYYDTTLSYWLTATVAEANCKLLTESEREANSHVIRYQVNALLWADAQTRAAIAEGGINTGRFSPDETRDWEGMNPRPDGEGGKFLRPMNMTTDGAEPVAGEGEDEPSSRSQRLELYGRLLRAALTRCVGRLAEHARRQTRIGRTPATIVRSLAREHSAVIESQLADVLAVIRAELPAEARAAWTTEVVMEGCFAGLRTVLDGQPAGDAAAAARAAARWQQTWPAEMAKAATGI